MNKGCFTFPRGSGGAEKLVWIEGNHPTNGSTTARDVHGNVSELILGTNWDSWKNDVGDNIDRAAVSVDNSGIVRLRGLIRALTGGGADIMLSLPVWARPAMTEIFHRTYNTGSAYASARIDVDPSTAGGAGGSVKFNGPSGIPAGAYIYLSGMSWMSAAHDGSQFARQG